MHYRTTRFGVVSAVRLVVQHQHFASYFSVKIIGTVVTVFGEMDEKGYYTASCNGTLGILPANFIQEVDLHDEKLIGRLMKQVRIIVQILALHDL